MEKLYTIGDVAKAYDLHPETLRDFCREGKIEYTRVGRCYRFSDAQLQKYEAKGGASAKRVRALERVERRLARAR